MHTGHWWKVAIPTVLAIVLERCGFNMEDQRGQEMTRAAAAAALASRHICFLTDVEGNWNYVRNFVRQSTCLRLTPTHDAQHPQPPEAVETDGYDEDLELNDDCFLVFGGDAGDKGGETLK
jgi:hypothetical protein